jgi:4a-hydroxytetrahydrobiopterin dehydratase
MELSKRKCVPCEGGVPRLKTPEINKLNACLREPWMVVDEIRISRDFNFTTYRDSIRFVNRVADIAEEEGHHPVMHVFFRKVTVDIWTFAILGLSENDFILAAKIEEIRF